MDETRTIILGGGMTGLAAGWQSGIPVFEAENDPGGICSSYYIHTEGQTRLRISPSDGEAYRFEIGGGHWIFGGDPVILRFIRTITQVNAYQRRSSVYFPEENNYIPYPIQNHLGHLQKDIRIAALAEMSKKTGGIPRTMAEWLQLNFGKTLTELFFDPFHRAYTAGLWKEIAPQDAYKSPIDLTTVIHGAFEDTSSVGYNITFLYPEAGLNALAANMAAQTKIQYGKTVVGIDPGKKNVQFSDGSDLSYETLISTLPLNKMMQMTGLAGDEKPAPFTSVLVLNIGAIKGPKCPDDHWLYIPASKSGFHRVGFYSNVDSSFLPGSSREQANRVSIYVERAYPGGSKPTHEEIRDYSAQAVLELEDWGFIQSTEVVDPTWIEVAYTWSWPGSNWRENALRRLDEFDIIPVGRYGRWIFQGIADSLRDGFFVGMATKGGAKSYLSLGSPG